MSYNQIKLFNRDLLAILQSHHTPPSTDRASIRICHSGCSPLHFCTSLLYASCPRFLNSVHTLCDSSQATNTFISISPYALATRCDAPWNARYLLVFRSRSTIPFHDSVYLAVLRCLAECMAQPFRFFLSLRHLPHPISVAMSCAAMIASMISQTASQKKFLSTISYISQSSGGSSLSSFSRYFKPCSSHIS